MDNEKLIREMIDKCDIFYDDLLISSEDIIKLYIRFFASSFNKDKKNMSFAFHTGSLCFDVASVAVVMLTCFAYNVVSNEDILSSLNIGDMILFKGERYRWEGIVTGINSGAPVEKYICIAQDGKGKNGPSKLYVPYQQNKHRVKPYFGSSTVTDGRGIRENKNNRNEFLAYVLNIPESDVPSVLDISVVVLADKGEFIDICQHLNISYGSGKNIQLTDIIPVSYFTESGEEMQIGKNPSKAEAIIKAVSKVSAARDLILDKHSNKVVGLLAINISSMTSNASDFKDLIRRKSLRFVIVTSAYSTESSDLVVKQYEDASIFACTREMLSGISTSVKSHNKLTDELYRQVKNIVGREVKVLEISGGWSWPEYRDIKSNIYTIRKSNWAENEKEEFVLSSLALLNLYTSSFFSMNKLEAAIEKEQINSAVISPQRRLKQLIELSSSSLSMKSVCEVVINRLLMMHERLYQASPKEDALYRLIQDNSGKKIAIIVPKAYYADLFQLYWGSEFRFFKIACCTANRFDPSEQYDLIIVTGDVVGKKFNPLQCYVSTEINMLLYECESKLFKHRKRISDENERKLNARIKGLKDDVYESVISAGNDDSTDEELNESIKKFSDLDEFVDSVGMFDIRKLMPSNHASGNYTGTAEVNHVGTFTTGEEILFSKYYSAVVYDRIAQKVKEKSPEKLVPGDVLVFTKRNDYTRNVVDLIFNQLIQNKCLTKDVQEAAEKACYWKKALREFKEKEQLTYRGIAKELKKLGSTLQEITVRQWLDEDSHIVGPRNAETMVLIAKLTQDPYMLAEPQSYFDACRIVRHYRREILNLIAQVINDKLSNKVSEHGSVFEVVYEHVENFSETMELENVFELEQTAIVNCNLVNRPIVETEVLL